MSRQEALQVLGLESHASPGEIEMAIASKQAQLKQALERAPTEALKTKYQQQLKKLDRIAEALIAAEQPSGNARAGLSRTKIADLPRSATQFDDGSAARVNLQAGDMLANRYQVQEQIGAGGMGAVYRALDKTTGKEIALKVLLPGLLKNERARERFLDEARISQQLSHPNIVNVFDVQQEGDFFFLTMELLEGQDLRQVMENRSLARQPFSEQEMRTIASQVCDALAYAHKYTVHRDLKPENVWLTEEGDYKLMDFGIARVQSTSQRTQTGAAMGTAYYMAPEQLKGQKAIDGRADQYALGVMLYELATGEVPAGIIKPMRELRKDLSKSFANAVMRTLNSGPDDRFADIAAFKEALNKGGGFELNLPWKGVGIAAGVLVAVLGVGALASSGSFSLEGLKSLLPMSKEEIAAERASLAKIQGEIKVLKQRLESSRRSLDSDVRDAERNDSDELEALRHWRRLTEDNLFAGSRVTELEGDLSMAETLLRDEAFEQARPVFHRVRTGYEQLLQQFQAAGQIFAAQQDFDRAQSKWQQLKTDYGLGEPAEVAVALELEGEARQQQRQGDVPAALESWQSATEQWGLALSAVKGDVARIEAEREAAAVAAKRKREAQAAAEKRRREAEAAAKAESRRIAAVKAKRDRELESAYQKVRNLLLGELKHTTTDLGSLVQTGRVVSVDKVNGNSCKLRFGYERSCKVDGKPAPACAMIGALPVTLDAEKYDFADIYIDSRGFLKGDGTNAIPVFPKASLQKLGSYLKEYGKVCRTHRSAG